MPPAPPNTTPVPSLLPQQAVAYFWADWAGPPCAQMDAVVAELAADYPGVPFLRARADAPAVEAATAALAVAAVPTVLFFKGGDATTPVARVEGADAPRVVDTATSVLGAAAAAAAAPEQPDADGLTPSLRARLAALTTSSPVMLFMKGVPDAPRCGFSRRVVDALRGAGVQFGAFDILSDDAVRAGLKVVSDWPTYPQLYAGGELLGGCDIVEELAAGGGLKAAVDDAVAAAAK